MTTIAYGQLIAQDFAVVYAEEVIDREASVGVMCSSFGSRISVYYADEPAQPGQLPGGLSLLRHLRTPTTRTTVRMDEADYTIIRHKTVQPHTVKEGMVIIDTVSDDAWSLTDSVRVSDNVEQTYARFESSGGLSYDVWLDLRSSIRTGPFFLARAPGLVYEAVRPGGGHRFVLTELSVGDVSAANCKPSIADKPKWVDNSTRRVPHVRVEDYNAYLHEAFETWIDGARARAPDMSLSISMSSAYQDEITGAFMFESQN